MESIDVRIRRHLEEWRAFFFTQKVNRALMHEKHQEQRHRLHSSKPDYSEVAKVISRQTEEKYEFKIQEQEERIILVDKHFRENAED